MAEIIRAIFLNPTSHRVLLLFNSHSTITSLPICKFRRKPLHKIPSLSAPSMAQASGSSNQSSDIEEPSPEIQKTPFLRVRKLSEKAILPSRASPLSVGYDLSSATEAKVPARGKALIPTDLSIAIPEGTYARIAPRSGLAWKHSIDMGTGVIDADYRGPVGVIQFNHSDVDFKVKAGDRIAQLIFQEIMMPEIAEVKSTVRGSGGFGSIGK